MTTTHTYELALRWTGNRGAGTSGFRDYDRAHELLADGRPGILGSSDPSFRGDPGRWNPEQLLVASLAQCHMLWYLHLAAVAGVVVTAYADAPTGTMVEDADGRGRFTKVTLRPAVTVADPAMLPLAAQLHEQARATCFIARSVAFPVVHEPTAEVVEPTTVVDEPSAKTAVALRQTVLDCTDARALAEFYRQLLGWRYRPGDEPPPTAEADPNGDDWLVLRNPSGAEHQLTFQQVGELPDATWPDGSQPQMVHLDLTVPDVPALNAEHERALALGARLLRDRSDDVEEPLRVYADPAGHPFCIFVVAPPTV